MSALDHLIGIPVVDSEMVPLGTMYVLDIDGGRRTIIRGTWWKRPVVARVIAFQRRRRA